MLNGSFRQLETWQEQGKRSGEKEERYLEENYTDEPLDLGPEYDTICDPLHTCPPTGIGVEAVFNNQVVLYIQ